MATDLKKEGMPTIGDRFTKDVVMGTLLTAHGDYSSFRLMDGVQRRRHVVTNAPYSTRSPKAIWLGRM